MSDGLRLHVDQRRSGRACPYRGVVLPRSPGLIDTYGRGTGSPHLGISHGEVSVSISPVPGRASAEDARIARELADKAAVYAAEVERLCAGNAARRSWDHGGVISRAGRQERQFLPPLVSPHGLPNRRGLDASA